MGNFLLGVVVTLLALVSIGLVVFKVFRRGALTFEVEGFYTHVMDGDPGQLFHDIQRDATPKK